MPAPKIARDLELERMLSLKEAAELVGVSQMTLRRHYPQFICRLSPWRVGIKLKHVLEITGCTIESGK